LTLRARQLIGQDKDLEEVCLQKQQKRIEDKEAFDRTCQIRSIEIKKGDLVLCHDSIAEIDMSWNQKLLYKWLGPYRVKKAISEKGTYILEEFDSTELSGIYAGNRLKKFIEQQRFYIPVATNQDTGSESSGSTSDEEEELLSTKVSVQRSAWIHQPTQPDVPRSGRFVIVSLTLTEEQRREYIQYEEDDKDNLL
jgi:hypothetical protein